MMDSTDMSTPVTRGELQDALGLFQRELKQELTLERQRELHAAVAPLATRAELHQEIQAAIAPLATRAELHQEIQAAVAPLATRAELRQEIQVAIALLATKAEIQAAYTRLMRAVHPDKGGTAGLAAQLNAARDRLLGR